MAVQFTQDGFSILRPDNSVEHVAWASVKGIFAFKIDVFAHDMIRVGFRVSDDGT
jgi:hypothetical protein